MVLVSCHVGASLRTTTGIGPVFSRNWRTSARFRASGRARSMTMRSSRVPASKRAIPASKSGTSVIVTAASLGANAPCTLSTDEARAVQRRRCIGVLLYSMRMRHLLLQSSFDKNLIGCQVQIGKLILNARNNERLEGLHELARIRRRIGIHGGAIHGQDHPARIKPTTGLQGQRYLDLIALKMDWPTMDDHPHRGLS